ncbi:MAG: alpha/beta hydrolase [Candidatus Verstraetearchaeota archaeon]|nr:alpha/beta hydrolase [Candidatus Verstraetearchaeota archaeon]
MKFSRRKKILISSLAVILILFFVVPFLIPIPPLTGTFPPDRLGKSDSRFVEVNGIKVHYKIYGAGEPVFILMHGFGAYSFSFDPVIRQLSEYGTVIAFDRPAFGFTERPILDTWGGPNPYTNEFAADLAVGLMDELGVDKAILVGHSAGGAVAILTYYRHPERVSALVLEDAAVYGGGAPWYIGLFLWLPQVQRLGPLLVRGIAGDSGISTIYLAWHDDSKITPDTIEGYRRPLMAEGWDYALWQFTLASGRTDLKSNLSKISVPVLVMTGSEDKIVPPANAIQLSEDIPGSTLVVIPDCGHIPHEECPLEFLDAVMAFLQSNSLVAD